MTKSQREKAERLMLKQMLETNPKLKNMIDALIDSPNVGTKDIIQPIIEEKLKEQRMIGIEIGWQAAFIRSYEKIKDMNTVGGIKELLRKEADISRKRIGLDSAFDLNGDLIIDEGE